MAFTVWGAFDSFRKNNVDLESSVTQKARSSRDFLIDQLKTLSKNDSTFPKLKGTYLPFGSFARRTKIYPLDDVDLMIPLVGAGTTVQQSLDDTYTFWLKITDINAPLALFPDGFGYVNSTKILNKFKSSLSLISHYQRSDIKKTMQAVALGLLSYDWVFDIVPAVPVTDGQNGTAYYLIPDGYSNWIRTDPRVDSQNITECNTVHDGGFLPTVRLLKYWNRRTHKPRLASYHFETLAVNIFKNAPKITSFQGAIKYFFDYCPSHLSYTCPDPKNLGPALDRYLDTAERQKVINALNDESTKAGYALMYEQQSNHSDAIYWWGRIFGSEFPNYG